MQTTIDRLRVEVIAHGCELPPEERSRLQDALTGLAAAVHDLAEASLRVSVSNHPDRRVYHVGCRLDLPGRRLTSAEDDPYLDSALLRAVARLTRKAEAYRDHPDRGAVAAAERRAALDREVVATEDPAAGPLADAVRAGDYRAFRNGLLTYEDGIRLRAGRLIDRHPEAVVGRDLLIGDVVEEVYLLAFDRFLDRPAGHRLSDFLEGQIEPAIKALLAHPDEEHMAASFARTVREADLG